MTMSLKLHPSSDLPLLCRPKRVLEQIKGISEQKATKILAEGECTQEETRLERRFSLDQADGRLSCY